MPPLGFMQSQAAFASLRLPQAISNGHTSEALHLLRQGADVNALGDSVLYPSPSSSIHSIPFLNLLLPRRRLRPVISLVIEKGNLPVLQQLLAQNVDLSTGATVWMEDFTITSENKALFLLCLIFVHFARVTWLPPALKFGLLMLPIEGYLWRTFSNQSINPSGLQIGKGIITSYLLLLFFYYQLPRNQVLETILYSSNIHAYFLRRLLLSLLIFFKVYTDLWRQIRYPQPGSQALTALIQRKGGTENTETIALHLLERMDLGRSREVGGILHSLLVWAVMHQYLRLTKFLLQKGIDPLLLDSELEVENYISTGVILEVVDSVLREIDAISHDGEGLTKSPIGMCTPREEGEVVHDKSKDIFDTLIRYRVQSLAQTVRSL